MKSELMNQIVLTILKLNLSDGTGMDLLNMDPEYFRQTLNMVELSEKSAPIQAPM